jgi:hypothetical protein
MFRSGKVFLVKHWASMHWRLWGVHCFLLGAMAGGSAGEGWAQEQPAGTYQLAVLQYRGGGDWYSNPTALPNLVAFCNQTLGMRLSEETPYVDVGSPELFDYPFVHMTGHGNVVFSAADARNLGAYLRSGGFLHISDNYGMEPFIRKEMIKVLPGVDWVELPAAHPVFQSAYSFPRGLPKIHEHDGEPPRAYALFWEGRMVCFLDVESDLGDGWEDPQVHRDPESLRQAALRMGANLVTFALSGSVEPGR